MAMVRAASLPGPIAGFILGGSNRFFLLIQFPKLFFLNQVQQQYEFYDLDYNGHIYQDLLVPLLVITLNIKAGIFTTPVTINK